MAAKNTYTLEKAGTPNWSFSVDLFKPPTMDVTLLRSDYLSIQPTNTVKGNPTINFQIPGTMAPNLYIDYSGSYLYTKVKVLNSDKSVLPADEPVAISNLFFHTMFQNLQVSVGDRPMSDTNMLYGYRGIFTNLLGSGNDVKTSLLSSVAFYPDSPAGTFTDSNEAWKTRRKMCETSKTFDLLGRPSAPLFELGKWVPGSVKVDMTFTKQAPAFALDATGKKSYIFSIEEATLYLKVNTVDPKIVTDHMRSWNSGGKAVFPYRDIKLTTASIAKGVTQFSTEQLFVKRKPSLIIVAFVEAAAFYGDYEKSAQNFAPLSVASVSIKSDEIEPFYKQLTCDYTNGLYLQPFNSLFSGLNQNLTGNGIDREIFKVVIYCSMGRLFYGQSSIKWG